MAEYRLGPMAATFLVSVLLIGFLTARQRLWESAQRTAVSERRLAEAQELAPVGSWAYEPATERVTWSREMYRILDAVPGQVVPSYAEQRQRLAEQDRLVHDLQSALAWEAITHPAAEPGQPPPPPTPAGNAGAGTAPAA